MLERDFNDSENASIDEGARAWRDAPPALLKPVVAAWLSVRDWWHELFVMSLASLAWAALTITVIGAAPALAALYAMARAAALHEHPDTSLFVTAFRVYFRKGWLLGLVGLAGALIWLVDLNFYVGSLNNLGALGLVGTVIFFYLGLVWLEVMMYAWALLICREDLGLRQLLRNGLLISLRFPLQNLASGVFVSLLFFAAFYLPPLVVLVIPPLFALLSLHNLYLLAPELVPDDSEALGVVG